MEDIVFHSQDPLSTIACRYPVDIQKVAPFGKARRSYLDSQAMSELAQRSAETESLFHQHWWLDAVAGSQWKEVTVTDNGTLIGRLPYFETRALGMRVLGMPPFTRTLGPWIRPVWKSCHSATANHGDYLKAYPTTSFSRLF